MVLARLDYGSTTLVCYLASFSLCSTLLHDWSALVVNTTTSRHCSVICTGCRFRRTSCFVWLCLPIGANMVWHRLIFQLIFTESRMLTAVGDFDPHRRQRCSFHARYSRQLVTKLSQLPLHARGTIYHPVSLQRPLCLLSERDSKTNFFLAVLCLDCLHAYACIILHASHLCLFSF